MNPKARTRPRAIHPLFVAALFVTAGSPAAAFVAAHLLAGTFGYRDDR